MIDESRGIVANLVLLLVEPVERVQRYCNRKLHLGLRTASWQAPKDHNSLVVERGRSWVAHAVVD